MKQGDSVLSLESGSRLDPVLLIDDDAALLDALAGMLRLRLGDIPVDTCLDPTIAVKQASKRSYKVIFCDLWMPKLNGLQLLPRLRAARPDAAVVLMSALCDHSLRHTARTLGATAVLSKPFDRDETCRLVRELLSTPRRAPPHWLQGHADWDHMAWPYSSHPMFSPGLSGR